MMTSESDTYMYCIDNMTLYLVSFKDTQLSGVSTKNPEEALHCHLRSSECCAHG